MRGGLKSQSHIRHQRVLGRFQSAYQHGGSIAYGLGLPMPCGMKPWMTRRRQKGGSIRKVIYPWMTEGRKYKRRRTRT